MQHRGKHRRKGLGVVWSTAYALVAGLGAYSVYLGGSGIASREVETFSRFNHGTITLASQPVAFCAAVALWLAGGLFMLGLAVHGWRTGST